MMIQKAAYLDKKPVATIHYLAHIARTDDSLSFLVVLLGTALVVVLNNQDLMLCARPFAHLLLVVHCTSASSSNDQKSTEDLASLVAPAKSVVSACPAPVIRHAALRSGLCKICKRSMEAVHFKDHL